MYSLVALASCLAVASASICCVPPQLEGSIGFLTGLVRNDKFETGRGSAMMAYDAVSRKIGQREYVQIGTGGQTMQIDVLMDYNADTKWIRQGAKCIKTKLNQIWDDGCIPDNATVIGKGSVFGFGTNQVLIDTYSIDFGGPVSLTFSVTSSGCIPVLESWRGLLDGVYFMENTGYVNLTAGISAPENLNTPPLGCENAPMVEAHYTQGMFNSGMVGRRSIFGF